MGCSTHPVCVQIDSMHFKKVHVEVHNDSDLTVCFKKEHVEVHNDIDLTVCFKKEHVEVNNDSDLTA
jgi:hypothetical protein